MVSVIIPNYNYESYLNETINSVYSQSYKKIECIVVDDGSTDNSLTTLEKLKKNKFPDLIVVKKENGGLSSARNAGIKIASGDYIAFLDADDLWTTHKIEKQITYLENNNLDIVYSNFTFLKDNKLKHHNQKFKFSDLEIYDFISGNPIAGSSSSIINRVGLFDCNLRSMEDLDYWFRCQILDYKFGGIQDFDVTLRLHSSSMITNHLKMLHYNVILLEKQIETLKKENINLNYKKLRKSILTRIEKVNWYSLQIGRKDYGIFSQLLYLNLLGIRGMTYQQLKLLIRYTFGLIFKRTQIL